MASLLDAEMIQKVLFLFRASPYASACGCRYSRNHPPPRLPTGRLKRSKIKKPPLAVKKSQIVAPSQPSPRGRRLIAMGSPSPTLPKGREPLLAVFKGVCGCPLPLGRVGEGLRRSISCPTTQSEGAPAAFLLLGMDCWRGPLGVHCIRLWASCLTGMPLWIGRDKDNCYV